MPPEVGPIAVPLQEPEVTVPITELPLTFTLVAESAVVDAYGNCDACVVEVEKKAPAV